MSDHIVQWRRLDRWPVTRRMQHRGDCLKRRWDRYSCSCKPGRLRAERAYEIGTIVRRVLFAILGVVVGAPVGLFAAWLTR